MQAGKLNKRATLKRLQESKDNYGGVTEAWVLLGHAWCGFIALRGSERATAIGSQAELVGTVFMRYSALSKSLTLGDVIEVDGQTYRVESPAVNESMKNQSITLMVSLE